MPRALEDIIKEIDTVYSPQRQQAQKLYESQIGQIDPLLQAERESLEAARSEGFKDIETRANRRGMFFSGIPLREQAQYLGKEYLPGLTSLRARYQSQRRNLGDVLGATLSDLQAEQRKQALGIREREIADEEDRRRWELEYALQKQAAARAGSGGGGGGWNFNGTGNDTSGGDPYAGLTLRQAWQQQANAGDGEAQVLLNYVGDNNRYDGPVNHQWELDILRRKEVGGNYYLRNSAQRGAAEALRYTQPTQTRSQFGPYQSGYNNPFGV